MAKYIFGIDLGTTYSCIAYVDETGRATVVNNKEGTNTTPSVVNFADPSLVVVGQVAKETAVIDPKNTISLVKTLMGKSNFAINYNGENLSPEVVSSYILRKLASDAGDILGTEVKDVVITCPAYFGTAERTPLSVTPLRARHLLHRGEGFFRAKLSFIYSHHESAILFLASVLRMLFVILFSSLRPLYLLTS